MVVSQLQSGLEVYINNYDYNIEDYIGQHVEMLLFIVRSPYLERGWKERLFSSDEYYSIELIDELIEEQDFKRGDNRKEVILTGDFIDSYTVPKYWAPLIVSGFFRSMLKEPSALKTKDGIYLLDSTHLNKRVPIEEFPQEVSIATGCIDLAAWHPI